MSKKHKCLSKKLAKLAVELCSKKMGKNDNIVKKS